MSEVAELNLWQKIVQVRQVAEGFSKDGKGYGYNYVSGNQVLSKIKDKMNELNLLLMPSTQVGEHHTHAYKTSRGKDALDFVVKGEMTYVWINADNPEEREPVSWAYYGQQDEISKAFGSGLTYSERYYLLKSLGLPTDEDDPDAKETKGNTDRAEKEKQANDAKELKAIEIKWKVLSGDTEGMQEWIDSMLQKGHTLEQLHDKLAQRLIEKQKEK